MTEPSWNCPACGFRVFNRRYPKCESCGAQLPQSLLYTDLELSALREQEQRARSEFEAFKAKEQAEAEAQRLSSGGYDFPGTYLSS